jgi:hypothetical protein
MTNGKTLIALSTAIALGLSGAASVAQASNENDGRGGYVLPGSTDGVNPVYHPGWFGKVRNPLPWWWNSPVGGRGAFAYEPAPGHKNKSR